MVSTLSDKAQVWAIKTVQQSYFETSFSPACTMVTRIGVTFLLISLFAVSDGRRKFEETFQKCPQNFECVFKSKCAYFNERIGELRRTKNNEIIKELKGLICNKDKQAICCRESICQSLDSCGKPQKIPESVKITRYHKEIKCIYLAFFLQIINGTKTSPGEFPFSGLIGYKYEKCVRLPPGPFCQVLWFIFKVTVGKMMNWWKDLNFTCCSAFKFFILITPKGMSFIKTLWLDSLKRIGFQLPYFW